MMFNSRLEMSRLDPKKVNKLIAEWDNTQKYPLRYSLSSSSSLQKPLAILFYPKLQDAAFNLTDSHAQARIKTLENVYDVRCFKINSIFKALKYAYPFANSNRKFDHMEFAGHGSQTELIFNKHVEGGVISTTDKIGHDELKQLISMVEPHGIIVTQSCSNGSTLLKQINLLQFIANLTIPGQRVIGASDTMNIIHMNSPWHFHFIQNLRDIKDHNHDQDVTCIYQKLKNGEVQRVSMDCIDFLLEHMYKGKLNFTRVNNCYRIMANTLDPTKELSLHKLPKRLISHLSTLKIKKKIGTEWFPIFNDLERLSGNLGWYKPAQLALMPEERRYAIIDDEKGIHYESHMKEGIYPSIYKFFLALSEFERYFDLIKMIDNGQRYDNNPAAQAFYRLTGHVWHPDLQALGTLYHNIELIKRSYPLVKKMGNIKLRHWFANAFPDGCFEARINAAHDYFMAHLIDRDGVFNENELFPEDTISQFVRKCYSSFCNENFRLQGITRIPNPLDERYLLYMLLHSEKRFVQFVEQQKLKYHLPDTKFNSQEYLPEIRSAGTCIGYEEVDYLLDQIVTRIYSYFENRERFIPYHLNMGKIVNWYPEQAIKHLKKIGYSVHKAVQFCIDHKLTKIDLIDYGDDVTNEMIEDLSKVGYVTHISIASYNVRKDKMLTLAIRYTNLKWIVQVF